MPEPRYPEDDFEELPAPVEEFDKEKGIKTVTEYRYNEDDKKVKVVRTIKIEKKKVSKGIAARKTWPKYGASANDKPGPSSQTTIIGEEVHMQFISNKEEVEKPEEDTLEKLRYIACRLCKGDHFTNNCPFKDSAYAAAEKKLASGPSAEIEDKAASGKYIAPSLRAENAGKRMEGYNSKKTDDGNAIRIANLSVNTSEDDLEDLVKQFGPINKMFLSKDKTNGLCKGYAFIHFKNKSDAAYAISRLNGYGFDHLILSVDWSKSHGQ